MDSRLPSDPNLTRFRAALVETYGPAWSGQCYLIRAHGAMLGPIPTTI
jgi:hypothetical protein